MVCLSVCHNNKESLAPRPLIALFPAKNKLLCDSNNHIKYISSLPADVWVMESQPILTLKIEYETGFFSPSAREFGLGSLKAPLVGYTVHQGGLLEVNFLRNQNLYILMWVDGKWVYAMTHRGQCLKNPLLLVILFILIHIRTFTSWD